MRLNVLFKTVSKCLGDTVHSFIEDCISYFPKQLIEIALLHANTIKSRFEKGKKAGPFVQGRYQCIRKTFFQDVGRVLQGNDFGVPIGE